MATLRKIISFYTRFTPSYSAIGYNFRRLGWRGFGTDFAGQTWLVNGGSEGIGASTARTAATGGATVIVVGRSTEKLAAFAASVRGPGQVITESVDFSVQADVWAFVDRLEKRGVRIDVLVNNVGAMKNQLIISPEGYETSFSMNLQSHYLFVRELLARDMIAGDGVVIEVSSGGMYNHPLLVSKLNNTGADYEGVRAYGLAKRGQVVLTRYWREHHGGAGRRFYAMHPGWVDTAGVRRSMPRFRRILRSVLRDDPQGADTIVWLAATRPDQKQTEAIWFDRKERGVHIYAHTPNSPDTVEDLVDFLERNANLLPEAERAAAARAAA